VKTKTLDRLRGRDKRKFETNAKGSRSSVSHVREREPSTANPEGFDPLCHGRILKPVLQWNAGQATAVTAPARPSWPHSLVEPRGDADLPQSLVQAAASIMESAQS
jgi:hypothetical protein